MTALEEYQRAVALYQSGQAAAAAAACTALIAGSPDFAAAYNLAGVLALDRNDAEAAIAALTRCIQLSPNDALALHNLGNAYRRGGDLAAAEGCFTAALTLAPTQHASALDLGVVLLALKRNDEALKTLQQAADAMPDFAEAPFQLGLALLALGRQEEAEFALRHAIALDPRHAQAILNLAILLTQSFSLGEAAELFRRLTQIQPVNAEAHWLLAATLGELGKGPEAIAAAERAVALAPNSPAARLVLARALDRQGRYADARSNFEAAVALDPSDAEARIALAMALNARGEWQAALAQYDAVLAINPDHPQALILRCIVQLPVNYETEEQIAERRAAFEMELTRLEHWVDRAGPEALARMAAVMDVSQPFLLTAQGLNDRELMRRYGVLTHRVMASLQPQLAQVPRAPDEPIRLGIVSGCFRVYTAWKILIEGYATKLDPKRVQIFAYYTRDGGDDNTERARRHATGFIGGKRPLAQWIETIAGDRLHALLYPDIFMEPVTNQLAALRLAPVQVALGSHPETTGFPTMDYHISSDLMEPDDAQDHYTETLIRLPNLATCFTPLDLVPERLRRADFGIPDDAVVYWSCQSTHKYLPQFDALFGRIADAVDKAFFVFIEQAPQHRANEVFHRRLERALGPHGTRYLMVPKMPLERFYGLAALSDIFLDTIGWSGNTTVMESLTAGLPVVTWPQALMRGRHAYGILRLIGVTDTIADSADAYVAIAARLGNDPAWRREISDQMKQRRDAAFNDLAPIRAFEDFLERVCSET
jgi:predicted O-linked N-acetylglucosamine transferase (SPINDLY family)